MEDKPQAESGARELDLTVLVTCYNEEEYIVDTLETVIGALREVGCTWEIIVIDDVSRDDSAARVKEYIAAHPGYPVTLIVNEVNRGLANNFIEGAFLGRGKYYRLCTGDNSEPREALVYIFKHMGKADLIIPYQNQGEIAGRTLARKIISRTFIFLVNLLGGYNIRYYNGLPLFRRYQVMRWPPITLGFGFQADLITRLLDEGVTYMQIPRWSLTDRKVGGSTALSMRNLLSVIHTFLEIVFRRVRRLLYRKYIPRAKEIRE